MSYYITCRFCNYSKYTENSVSASYSICMQCRKKIPKHIPISQYIQFLEAKERL